MWRSSRAARSILPWLRAALTPAAVGQWYRHLRAAGPPRVDRYEVGGFHALNLVVHDALEGGINASTQLDPAAKGMGQMLLRFPVPVPAALAAQLAAARTEDCCNRLRRPKAVNDYSYLMKGLTRVPTTSSTLVSSSKYLNDPRIRDWVATHLLRKNGPDAPTPSDPMPLVLALREVQDINHINELFAAERKHECRARRLVPRGLRVELQARIPQGLSAAHHGRHLLQAADGQ